MSKTSMRVLVVRPGKMPVVEEITKNLYAMQQVVGGSIEALYPWEDTAAIICNEEGKLIGLPANQFLTDEEDNVYDLICGTFFVVGLTEDDFCSLSEVQLERYRKLFSRYIIPTN